MREAQRVTDEALLEILNFIKPGLTESEVAARLTYIMARKGAERNSFDPIVACGANGSKPHAVPGPAVIEKGQFVTMDFGCVVGGYCSDMTRTVAVGQPTEEMELVYNTVLCAQLAGIAAAHGGDLVLDIINSIMPGLLSILLVFGLVRLIKKGHKPITLVFGILLISIVLAFFGIF